MFNLSWEVHGSVSFSLSVSDLHIGEFVRCSVGRKKTPYELSHSFIESMIVCAAYKQVQYKKNRQRKNTSRSNQWLFVQYLRWLYQWFIPVGFCLTKDTVSIHRKSLLWQTENHKKCKSNEISSIESEQYVSNTKFSLDCLGARVKRTDTWWRLWCGCRGPEVIRQQIIAWIWAISMSIKYWRISLELWNKIPNRRERDGKGKQST